MTLYIIQQIEREGPGFIYPIATEYLLNPTIIRPYLGESLPEISQGDGLVFLGGPMGIADMWTEKYFWLKDQLELITYSLSCEIPVMGVCLGAQLLACAAGGSAEPMMINNVKGSEIGWSQITVTPEIKADSISKYMSNDLHVLHWHGDRINLPKESVLLATSSLCNEQLFRIGQNSYGLQFHIELKENDVYKWIEEDHEFIENGLGYMGRELLVQQNKLYYHKSLAKRMRLLKGIIGIMFVKDRK